MFIHRYLRDYEDNKYFHNVDKFVKFWSIERIAWTYQDQTKYKIVSAVILQNNTAN